MRLNLKTSVVEDYYKQNSTRISSILSTIEPVEFWVLDNDKQIVDTLTELTEVLNDAGEDVLSSKKEDILKILAYLSCSKVYFFTNWLDFKFSNDLSVEYLKRSADLSDTSAEFSIYVERMEIIKKMDLLGSIFSEKRLRNVISILELVKDKIDDDDYDFF